MSAIIDIDQTMRPIRRSTRRIERLRMEDGKEPKILVRAINALIEMVSTLAENEPLEYLDVEDLAVTSGTTYRVRHGFKGRVRLWPVEWAGAAAPGFSIVVASSDDDVVAFTALATGRATLRVQRSSQ
jgi:hypothetical protein